MHSIRFHMERTLHYLHMISYQIFWITATNILSFFLV